MRVTVSSVEEETLATLEGLEEAIEDKKEPPIFRQGEQGTLVILGSDFGVGGRGRDEPTDLESKPSDSKGEEENEEDEQMADQNLEWIT